MKTCWALQATTLILFMLLTACGGSSEAEEHYNAGVDLSDQGRFALAIAEYDEAIFLDPVYSSKAMAGLIDHIRQGRVAKGECVIFVHTGGTPALFSYAEDLLTDWGRPPALPTRSDFC